MNPERQDLKSIGVIREEQTLGVEVRKYQLIYFHLITLRGMGAFPVPSGAHPAWLKVNR